ncbi:MAG: raffinose/stachyose/melibiose transport system substrate-binding protein [Frankiales bacterium]|jgi:raffinose/stachyose/melibiose transport system substrate-binding protein|nr:raffinose/stachyose/melibiose transport system substrate-binding protein [Frankiales bacterium]
MKTKLKIAGVVLSVISLAACSGGASSSNSAGTSPSGQIKPREISWLLSRPADGAVLTTMQSLADEYAKTHPGFSLKLITTPDRPSYIQKYETLAAGNKLPDLFDTDATPFAQKLATQGRMMDVSKLLKDLGLYDNYRPSALNYQRFDDGSLYMIPFEYQLEFFWYNKSLFKSANVSVPTSLDQLPALCQSLRAKGITPIAVDGQDQWPLERYMAYQPFRQAGPGYVRQLKQGKVLLSDAVGQKAVTWLGQLGSSKCFENGFSSTGYSDAQALFTSGKAAIYNIGTWELSSLATDKLSPTVRNDVDFFTLPTTANSSTAANEYVSPSGIGMAVNAKTYDPLVRDFLKYSLTNYPAKYAALGNLSPTSNVQTTIPSNATPLYKKAIDSANDVGEKIAMPWDTQLDPTSNTRLQQELVLLVQGDTTPSKFISTMDATIKQNAPKYYG